MCFSCSRETSQQGWCLMTPDNSPVFSSHRMIRRIVLLLLLLALALMATAADAADRIAWYSTLKQGLAVAKPTGRPILLVSAAPHCHGISGIW